MNNELLLLDKKHTDTLIEQTKTRPQETLEFKMNKQMQTLSFNPPINLVEGVNGCLQLVLLSVNILFLKSPTKTLRSASLYQAIGKPNLMKELLMN